MNPLNDSEIVAIRDAVGSSSAFVFVLVSVLLGFFVLRVMRIIAEMRPANAGSSAMTDIAVQIARLDERLLATQADLKALQKEVRRQKDNDARQPPVTD